MPRQSTLNLPVVKKNKKATKKSKTVKRKIDIDDASSDTSCTENKVPKLKGTGDDSSSVEDEMQAIINVLDNSPIEQLCERKEHIDTIRQHLDQCLKNTESVSLYICGFNGTGKTASIEFLMSQKDVEKNFMTVYVNCLTYRFKRADVYKEIVQKLGGDTKGMKTQKDSVDKMLKIMNSKKKPILLILDDVDVLANGNTSKKQEILYSLFELPTSLAKGQIALITVGNILTLVDHSLPLLRSFFFKKPVTLQFSAYNDKDIVNILARRLNKVNLKRITIDPPAIELLGRRAASMGGDAREALQLTKQVVEVCVSKNTKDGYCTIRVPDVFQATNDILGEVEKLKCLDEFPKHQKLIICAVLKLIEDSSTFDRTKLNIYAIEDMYRKICKKNYIDCCISTEFINLISLIELSGIFSINGKKVTRSSKVTVNWDENDIRGAFTDKTFFGNILNCKQY